MPAARGPARENVLNAREPDARKKNFLARARSPWAFEARARCPRFNKSPINEKNKTETIFVNENF